MWPPVRSSLAADLHTPPRHSRRQDPRVGFSPDGTSFIIAADDGSANVGDASTGNCLVTLAGDEGVIYKASLNPSGEYLASLSTNGTFTLYKRSGDVLASMPKALALNFPFVCGVGKIVAMVVERAPGEGD